MNTSVRVVEFETDAELLNYALTHSRKTPISESKSINFKLTLSEDGHSNACVYFKEMKIATISYWGSFLINRKNIGLLNQSELNELTVVLKSIDLYSVITHHLGYTSTDPAYVSYRVAVACVKEQKKLGYIATIKKEPILLTR